MTNNEYIEEARKQYQSEGSIEIDDGAKVSRGGDTGAYVAAWVWVEDPSGIASEDDPDQDTEVDEERSPKGDV